MKRLKTKLRRLYYGNSSRAKLFNTLTIFFDIAIVCYFVGTTFVDRSLLLVTIDLILGIILGIDFAIRVWLSKHRLSFLSHPLNLIDLLIVITLIIPTLIHNYAFLRIIRSIRILRARRLLEAAARQSGALRRREETLAAITNILAFLFIVTAMVYVSQAGSNPEINNYIDALYYSVTTVTTTGFGDIILVGPEGKLLASMMMLLGLSLFVRLIQTVFRPMKVRYTCHECGLKRHDLDAIHCKHCGEPINIGNEGW